MRDRISLEGKVAIITGAAGGIGSATAALMIRRGATVVLADIAEEAANTLADKLGAKAVAQPVDLSSEDSIKTMIAATIERFGRLDILHNNAADLGNDLHAVDLDIEQMPTWAWDRTYKVNVRGTMIACREALPHLVNAGGGSIINMVSNLALQGHIIQSAYSSSKSAVIQMTRSIAASHGLKGVRCNAVAPGLTLTESVKEVFPKVVHDLVLAETLRDTLGEPQDLAEVVAFLASDSAKNITGQILASDGGLSTHVPGIAGYRALSNS